MNQLDLGIIGLSHMKPDELLFLPRVFGSFQQLLDRLKDNHEILVVLADLFLNLPNLTGEIFVRNHQLAKLDEGAHDRDVHLNCAGTSQDTGKHRHTLLGKGVGQISSPAITQT